MYKFNNVLLHGLLLACLAIMPVFAANNNDEGNSKTQNPPNQGYNGINGEFGTVPGGPSRALPAQGSSDVRGEQEIDLSYRHGWGGGYRHHFGYYYGRPYYYRPYYYYYPYSSPYYYPYNSYYYNW